MDAILSARHIRKSYGAVDVIHGIDLDVAANAADQTDGSNGGDRVSTARIYGGDFW